MEESDTVSYGHKLASPLFFDKRLKYYVSLSGTHILVVDYRKNVTHKNRMISPLADTDSGRRAWALRFGRQTTCKGLGLVAIFVCFVLTVMFVDVEPVVAAL